MSSWTTWIWWMCAGIVATRPRGGAHRHMRAHTQSHNYTCAHTRIHAHSRAVSLKQTLSLSHVLSLSLSLSPPRPFPPPPYTHAQLSLSFSLSHTHTYIHIGWMYEGLATVTLNPKTLPYFPQKSPTISDSFAERDSFIVGLATVTLSLYLD